MTESRAKTRYPTRQDEWEWYEYNTVVASLSKASGVPIESIIDIRGNHDTFGVGLRGGSGDFYPKYGAIGGRSNRTAGALQRVFAVALEVSHNNPENVYCRVLNPTGHQFASSGHFDTSKQKQGARTVSL